MIATIKAGAARLPKRPLRLLLRGLAERGFTQRGDDIFARPVEQDVIQLFQICPGWGRALSQNEFFVNPVIGIYYDAIDKLSHALRGTPYPRSETWGQIGASLDVLASTIPPGGLRFLRDDANESVTSTLFDALAKFAFPAVEKLASVEQLILLLEGESTGSWSVIVRDILPLAYLAKGRHVKAVEVSRFFLREIESEEPKDSPLLISYTAFVSAISEFKQA